MGNEQLPESEKIIALTTRLKELEVLISESDTADEKVSLLLEHAQVLYTYSDQLVASFSCLLSENITQCEQAMKLAEVFQKETAILSKLLENEQNGNKNILSN